VLPRTLVVNRSILAQHKAEDDRERFAGDRERLQEETAQAEKRTAARRRPAACALRAPAVPRFPAAAPAARSVRALGAADVDVSLTEQCGPCLGRRRSWPSTSLSARRPSIWKQPDEEERLLQG